MIIMNLDLKNNDDFPKQMRITGQVKLDRQGNPNPFFFNPEEDGYNKGFVDGKMRLVRSKKISVSDAFTFAELEEARRRRYITQEEADTLKREVGNV